ncbi:hypothetical protein IJ531_06315, partial [bacterium]|nr:hypothetical protein [bacterium]
YCAQMADIYSLDKAAECAANSTKDVVNISFPNGTTIQGLASEWKKPFAEATYMFKNIVVDIDGPKGLNKIWADRYPLRIYAGIGKGAEGTIMPINCGNDVVYKEDTDTLITMPSDAQSPYCAEGFAANGTKVTKNYALDDEIITYDVYKPGGTEENSKAIMVASAVSPMMADCMAYGSSMGFYSVKECDAAKIQIKRECATQTNCATCTSNTCPNNEDDTGKTTPSTCADMLGGEIVPSCMTIMHKPNSGASFVIQSLIGDIDDFDQ